MTTLIDLFTGHGVLLVFFVTFAARVGLPVPAAPVLVIAGGMASVNAISAPLALAVATLANLLGDAVWYEAGRRQGHRVMKLLCRVSLSPDSCVRQSESLITRWGGRSLVAAKFLPGISVVAAPMAGALGMSLRRFVVFDLLAGALWSAVFLGLGLLLRDQIQRVLEVLAEAGLVATVALLAIVAGLIAQRAWRRQSFLRAARKVRRLGIAEVAGLIERGEPPVFIDVRGPGSVGLDPRRIPGAWPVELKTLAEHAARLPRERLLVAYCNCPNEVSAAKAAQTLAGLGFERVAALVGGLDGWVAAGRPVEHGESGATPLREPEVVGAL
ncbi:VTT domain-containing protein [Paucibacter sp. R3-3]|uniref:VTT domain-containing protein n=1 Tax=Roseateles agri TaxID=3098619 RepID=A0ABU5DPN8_9BURK|nr:VTT domain-containing protein [Paucibacter sp. R3-3]MDY0748279.1 VTT domain-containing protein [Paucibacter sp. R3-3]